MCFLLRCQGVGALYIRRRPRVRVVPVQSGGGQERGIRSGTVPTPLVVGLGAPCELASQEMEVRGDRGVLCFCVPNLHCQSCQVCPTKVQKSNALKCKGPKVINSTQYLKGVTFKRLMLNIVSRNKRFFRRVKHRRHIAARTGKISLSEQ